MLRCVSGLPRLPIPSFRRNSLSKISMEAAPLCPKFVPVEQSEVTSNSKGCKFSVVSYNILAQVYVKSSYFPHSPSSCLKWKARSQAVLTVLKSLEADFLCLQEVDEYEEFYRGNMESYGYSSIYIQRSGKKCDGCGIFYKPKRAELVLRENIEYNNLADSIKGQDSISVGEKGSSTEEAFGSDHGDPNDPYVRLKRDCVGVMAAFKLRGPSQHLVIVANTHLYWDPAWADVKLAQAKYLLSRLAQFKSSLSERFDGPSSIILTGDFNSTPGDKCLGLSLKVHHHPAHKEGEGELAHQVYQYLVSGNSPVECSDELPIPLCSVYAETRGEPLFTNCTPDFTDTLDFIFFSPRGEIKPVSFLELPDADSPSVVGGLPNYQHPSDHLPIGAEFEVIRD